LFCIASRKEKETVFVPQKKVPVKGNGKEGKKEKRGGDR
jgi:hypothetical protein